MNSIPSLSLGERLRLARTRARIAPADMACRLTVSRSSISGYELDQSRPSLEHIDAWAMLTNVDLCWLAFGRNPGEESNLPTISQLSLFDGFANYAVAA